MLKDKSSLLQLIAISVGLAILYIFIDHIILTKLINEIWEHRNIDTTKSGGARNTSGPTIKKAVNKPTKLFWGTNKISSSEMSVIIPIALDNCMW